MRLPSSMTSHFWMSRPASNPPICQNGPIKFMDCNIQTGKSAHCTSHKILAQDDAER